MLKSGVLLLVVVALAICGCSQPPAPGGAATIAKAVSKNLIYSGAIVPMSAALPSGLVISNINGTAYGWTNGNLAFSRAQVFTGYGGTWTSIQYDAFGHVAIYQPNQIVIEQMNYTPLSTGITYATSIPGTNVYYLARSGDLRTWYVVNSRDSPQTNSWPANLLVDDRPDPRQPFYRVGVE